MPTAEDFIVRGIVASLSDEDKMQYDECLKQVESIADKYPDVFPIVLAALGVKYAE